MSTNPHDYTLSNDNLKRLRGERDEAREAQAKAESERDVAITNLSAAEDDREHWYEKYLESVKQRDTIKFSHDFWNKKTHDLLAELKEKNTQLALAALDNAEWKEKADRLETELHDAMTRACSFQISREHWMQQVDEFEAEADKYKAEFHAQVSKTVEVVQERDHWKEEAKRQQKALGDASPGLLQAHSATLMEHGRQIDKLWSHVRQAESNNNQDVVLDHQNMIDALNKIVKLSNMQGDIPDDSGVLYMMLDQLSDVANEALRGDRPTNNQFPGTVKEFLHDHAMQVEALQGQIQLMQIKLDEYKVNTASLLEQVSTALPNNFVHDAVYRLARLEEEYPEEGYKTQPSGRLMVGDREVTLDEVEGVIESIDTVRAKLDNREDADE